MKRWLLLQWVFVAALAAHVAVLAGFLHLAWRVYTFMPAGASLPRNAWWVLLLPAKALFFVGLSVWWLVQVRRKLREPVAGCCKHCGYDLRATPDRCPECGRGVGKL